MIAIYHRVVTAIAVVTKIPDRDHLLTGKLYGCNIMRPVSAGIQAMSCQRSPPTVVCSMRMRSGGDVTSMCHSLVKALQCWWAPAAASLSTLARRHQLSDYTHGRYDRQTDAATDLDVSHTT